MAKVVIAFHPDHQQIGKTVDLDDAEAAALVREGRARYATTAGTQYAGPIGIRVADSTGARYADTAGSRTGTPAKAPAKPECKGGS